jgi:hypothetical protein
MLGETALAILMDRDRRPIEDAIATHTAIGRMSPLHPHDRATELARTAVAKGRCVLWIRGTVTDAVADFQKPKPSAQCRTTAGM